MANKTVSAHITDHLANERTFLAWLRTSVALMGFGVVIVRLRELAPTAAVVHGRLHAAELGLLFALFGLLMMPLALWQYLSARRGIDSENYRPAFWSIIIFAVALCALGVVVIIYLARAISDIPVSPSFAPSLKT